MEGLETYITNNYTFDKLPAAVKQTLGNSKREWDKVVVEYALSHQLRWRKSIVRRIITDQRKYYEQLLAYSRDHLMLYPYHLSDVMVVGLKTTPFQYYYEIFASMLRREASYDSLPNFSAADGLSLLGIGRNQYIELMNMSKSKNFFRKRVNPKTLLPAQAIGLGNVAHWWDVAVGFVTEEDIKNCTQEEHVVIDRLIDRGATLVGVLDRAIVESLYVKNLIFFIVPIHDDDRIVVPPLENFVMNRVLGDYFENLLYKIFVSIDENTTIAELASLLRIDTQLVKDAVSVYCRLGFAFKKGAESVPPGGDWHPSWRTAKPFKPVAGPTLLTPLNPEGGAATPRAATPPGAASTSATAAPSPRLPGEWTRASRLGKRIAFLFDSTLTAFLMMGNLSAGLKKHAVTMFEAGKLSDESLDDFLAELQGVAGVSEGEAQRYFEHAVTLRSLITFMRHNPALDVVDATGDDGLAVDLVRIESLNSLDVATLSRVLRKNYALLISMVPLSRDVRSMISCIPPHLGPAIPEVCSAWFKLWLYQKLQRGPPSILFVAGQRVAHVPAQFQDYTTVLMTNWTSEPQVVNTATLLAPLNDALCHSPVLVQGLSKRAHAVTAFLAFPIVPPERLASLAARTARPQQSSPSDTSSVSPADASDAADAAEAKPPAGDELNQSRISVTSEEIVVLPKATGEAAASADAASATAPGPVATETGPALPGAEPDERWRQQCERLQQLPAVQALAKAMDLEHSCGYITLVNPLCNTSAELADAGDFSNPFAEVSHFIPDSSLENPEDWVVFDVSFGMPLFDAWLSRAVCEGVLDNQLFSEASLSRQSRLDRTMALELLDFIASNQNLPLDLDPTAPSKQHQHAHPTHALQSVEGAVAPFHPAPTANDLVAFCAEF